MRVYICLVFIGIQHGQYFEASAKLVSENAIYVAPFLEMRSVSMATCISECSDKIRCNFINWNKSSGTCQLVEGLTSGNQTNNSYDVYKISRI